MIKLLDVGRVAAMVVKKKNSQPELSFPITIQGIYAVAGCFTNENNEVKLTTGIDDIKDEVDGDGPVITYYTVKK